MPTGLARLATLAAAALATACAHAPRPEVARASSDLRCEDAAGAVARRARTHLVDELRRSATTPLSIVLSGAGFVTDGAVVVSSSVVLGGALCAPIGLIEAAGKGDGSATGHCFVEMTSAVIEAMPAPGIGRGVYRATRSWRCPDFVQLSREVRAVSACYARRDDPGDRHLAVLHLEQLRGDREILECLPPGERRAVEEARARIFAPAPAPAAPPPAPGAEDEAPPPPGDGG